MSAIYIQMSAVVYKVNCLYTKVSCLYTNVSCLFTYVVLFTKKQLKTCRNILKFVSRHATLIGPGPVAKGPVTGPDRVRHLRTRSGVRTGGPVVHYFQAILKHLIVDHHSHLMIERLHPS